MVEVPERLVRSHPVVEQIRRALAERRTDLYGRRGLTAPYAAPSVLVTPNAELRVMRLLHGLFKVLEARGHRVELKVSSGYRGSDLYDLHVQVGEESVGLAVMEPVTQRPHALSAEQASDQKRLGFYLARKHDYVGTGRLSVAVGRGSCGSGRSWRDGKRKRLEDLLGWVVLAVEDQARAAVAGRESAVAAEHARAQQRRRELELELGQRHQHALAEDLEAMVQPWSRAQTLRAFLRSVEGAIQRQDQTEAFSRWIGWARSYADRLDPLARPHEIAKVVEPDPTNIPEPTGGWSWSKPTDEQWQRVIRLRLVGGGKEEERLAGRAPYLHASTTLGVSLSGPKARPRASAHSRT